GAVQHAMLVHFLLLLCASKEVVYKPQFIIKKLAAPPTAAQPESLRNIHLKSYLCLACKLLVAL
ncbi:MAG: hypothetical protein U0K79_08560, partial [Phascolarctobacterium sp.]|nr:hypothetical protein [Phascolarctobacterium sp.]